MGCISVQMGFMLQTPAFGVVSNVRRKENAWVLVRRRSSCIKSTLSTSQMESNMVVKEDTEFKSSFDEYLKAMESIRTDREMKKVQRGSGREKKLSDVAVSKDLPKHQKRRETVKFKRFVRSDSKKGDEWSERVSDKKELRGSVQAGNSIRSKKEANYVGSKNGSSKKLDVDIAASTRTRLVKKKGMPMKDTIDDNQFERERFIFQESELFNNGLDSPRVSRMEMEERIQSLARCLNNAEMDMPEWMFAKTMRSARIRFSDHSIMRVIQILGKYKNWPRVLQVIEWLQTHDRYKSLKISCT